MTEKETKLVYHPEHYNKAGRKECWEEMREIFGDEAVIIFDVLSAYKYSYRFGDKENNTAAQDDAKIHNYLNHANSLLEKCEDRKEAYSNASYVYDTFNYILENNSSLK